MDNTPPLVTDLEDVARLAKERSDDFEVMRYMLELNDEVSDARIDTLVEEIAAPIIAAIDCTQCGNCCRVLDVYLTPTDVQQLAAAIDIPVDEIETRYVDHDAARKVGEWGKFKASPCAFLCGKRCSVYAHRPETCRTYPVFTPDFRWTLEDIIEGASICPIIYNVLDRMVDAVDSLYE